MKNKFIALFLICLSNFSYAQTEDSLKPVKGNFTTELNINPLKGQISLNNTLNQLRGRYFIQDGLALRLGLGLNIVDTVGSNGNPYGTNNNYRSMTFKSTTYDLNFGVEKHFSGTRRLSPFVGFEVSYGNKTSNYTEKTNDYELEVENGWYEEYIDYTNGWSRTRYVSQGFSRFGVAAIAGFDFYISKNFYLGYEFNLAYQSTKFKDPKITSTGQYSNNSLDIMDNSVSKFGAKLSNGIRLGFAF